MDSNPKSDLNFQNYMKLQYLVKTKSSAVLRKIFCDKWKSISYSDWGDTSENGKDFIDGLGKNLHKNSGRLQKNMLQTGNIDMWDLPLLIQAIKCLEINTSDKTKKKEMHKKFEKLKTIRNELDHQGTAEVTQEKFEKYWNDVCTILISFGITREDLDEAKVFVSGSGADSTSQGNCYIDKMNVEAAEKLKNKGNSFFAKDKFYEAIEAYSDALTLSGIPTENLAVLYSNRSVAFLKWGDPTSAKDDAKVVVHIRPAWWRGYFRLANSYEEIEKYEQAIKYIDIALKLDPPKSEVVKLIKSQENCRRMWAESNRDERVDTACFVNTKKYIIDEITKRFGTDELHIIDEELQQKLGFQTDACTEGHRFLHIDSQDYELAAQRFAKAASKGSAEAMYNLAMLYFDGKGILRSAEKGIEMLKQAAAQKPFIYLDANEQFKMYNFGVKEAEHALGHTFYKSSSFRYASAFSWYEAALKHGSHVSANNIANIYERGELGERNIDKAVLYWKFAAQKGVVKAMENLATYYHELGEPSKAFHWYTLAMEKGSSNLPSLKKSCFNELEFQPKFESQNFLEDLKKELMDGPLKPLMLQDEEITRTLATIVKKDCKKIVKAPTDDIIQEHRQYFQDIRKNKGMLPFWEKNSTKLKSKSSINVFGLQSILLKEMNSEEDKIYEDFAIKLTIIEDAIIGKFCVALIGQDDDGNILRIFLYNIPLNKKKQNHVGYGCRVTLVNPYYTFAIGCKPAICVTVPVSIIYHDKLTDKSRCRYCGAAKGQVPCQKCKRVFYCTQNCLEKDTKENKHELVCVQNI